MLYKNHKHIGTVEQSYTKEVAKKFDWVQRIPSLNGQIAQMF